MCCCVPATVGLLIWGASAGFHANNKGGAITAVCFAVVIVAMCCACYLCCAWNFSESLDADSADNKAKPQQPKAKPLVPTYSGPWTNYQSSTSPCAAATTPGYTELACRPTSSSATAPVAHSDGGPAQWEWEETYGTDTMVEWIDYDTATNAALNKAWRAFCSNKRKCQCDVKINRTTYRITFEPLGGALGCRQKNMSTGNIRRIRRTLEVRVAYGERGEDVRVEASVLAHYQRKAAAVATATSALPKWSKSTRVQRLSGGTTKITLTSANVGSHARESFEWNMAVGQFKRLTGGASKSIAAVDVYSCPAVEQQYHQTRAAFTRAGTPDEEVWVFHGSMPSKVCSIMTGGFRVGGVDAGVAVANGALHGHGVYTAKGPGTPMSYAGGGKEVILARALQGHLGEEGNSDCWEPKGDWAVFRDGRQLLPVYVVRFR